MPSNIPTPFVDCGFRVPPAVLINGVTSENLQANAEKVLEYFESKMDKGELPYSCDGLVFTILKKTSSPTVYPYLSITPTL